jgi:hypothetical protein|tara:strand:- start:2441 stop:3172 length:732 start_codon:yes stop_codon:yes gene_type:complete
MENSNYPKSSCNCYGYKQQSNKLDRMGNPTNMSVVNCRYPSYFENQSTFEFKPPSIQPTFNEGYKIINPQAIEDKYSNDFERKDCNLGPNVETVYVDTDPRLMSAPRAQYIALDRPPAQSKVDINKIATDKSLDNYGQHYSGYSDINAGQIVYYINNERKEPFYGPNFSTSALTTSTLDIDPMGQISPSYVRHPLKDPEYLNTTKKNYTGCLSWIQDSMSHREDLMSKQMSKYNKERWEPRWE